MAARAARTARAARVVELDPAEVVRRRIRAGRHAVRRALRARWRASRAVEVAEAEAGRALRQLCAEGLCLATVAAQVGVSREVARRLVTLDDPAAPGSTGRRITGSSTASGAERAPDAVAPQGQGDGTTGASMEGVG